jgi:hypothetical protein
MTGQHPNNWTWDNDNNNNNNVSIDKYISPVNEWQDLSTLVQQG